MKSIFAVLLAACLSAASAADFSAWKDSTRIFINTSPSGADIQAPVGHFPLLVRLDSTFAGFPWMREDGADLRFADPDRTLLSHEVEHFDRAGRTAAIWVRVPQVDAQSETDHIVFYWNNPAAASVAGGGAVFDTSLGYAGVWHLAEDGGGTPDTDVFKDATRNANHGDDFVSSPRKAGTVGYGHEFDGQDDYLHVPSKASLQLRTSLTLSAWVKGDAFYINAVGTTRAHAILRKGDDNPNSYQLGVIDGRFFCALDAGDRDGVQSQIRPEAGKWYHVAATWGPNRILALYVNGVEDASLTTSSAGPLTADSRPLYIGGRTGAALLDSRDIWDGVLDELRVSRVVHTPQHLKLSYENQKPGSKVLSFRAFPPAAVPDDILDWPRSRRLFLNTTVAGAGVAGRVVGFPLLVRLDSANFDFSEAEAGGKDLRFTDPQGFRLPHAVERWDAAARKAEVWVRVPEVEGDSRHGYVRMHWGMAGAADVQNPAGVFDTADGFAGVWHLAEGDAGRSATAEYRDETSNKNHGLDYAEGAGSEAVAGKGQEFGSQGDYVQVPYHPALVLDKAITFSAWIRGNAWETQDSSRVHPIVRKGAEHPNPYQLAVSGGRLAFYLNETDERGRRGPTPLQPGRWYHVAAAWDRGHLRLYLDGNLELEAEYPQGTADIPDTRPLFIGGRFIGVPTMSADWFGGRIDEVQASRVARSADWIRLAYQNQSPSGRLVEHEGIAVPADTGKPADTPGTAGSRSPVWNHDVTLEAGGTWSIDSVLRLDNPGPGRIRVTTRPSGDTAAPGVKGVEAIFRVEAVPAGGPLPPAILTVDPVFAGDRRLFLLVPGRGPLGRLSDRGPGAGARMLVGAGEYLLARDTAVPVLRPVGRGIGDSDSSWMEVVLEDNQDSLSLAGGVSGAEGAASLSRRVASGAPVRLAFLPVTQKVPLKLSLLVSDGGAERSYPPRPAAAYTLARRLPPFAAPLAAKAGLAWGLFGFPVRPARPLTLEALGEAAGAGRLYGAVWEPDAEGAGKGAYRILSGGDTLPAGAGVWLAGEKGFASLPLDRTLTESPEDGIFRIALRRGWNQIANPSLEPLPWPVSHADTVAHDLSEVKGLRAYGGDGLYLDADTLRPWSGYFVYSRRDTVVSLLPRAPSATPAAKPAAAKPGAVRATGEAGAGRAAPIRLVLRPEAGGDGMPAAASLRLGAAAYAEDAVGVEDEPMPPAPGRRAGLAAARAGRGLRTDLLAFRPGATHAWKLAWSGDGSPPAPGRLRVASLAAPAGTELWAASPLGTGARRLAAGDAVDLPAAAGDTLVIWASPAGRWREGDLIPGLAPRPGKLGVAITAGRQGAELRLALPEAAALDASAHAADGRRLARLERGGIAPGYHVLRMGEGKAWPRGLLFVTVELRAAAGRDRSRRVFRVLVP